MADLNHRIRKGRDADSWKRTAILRSYTIVSARVVVGVSLPTSCRRFLGWPRSAQMASTVWLIGMRVCTRRYWTLPCTMQPPPNVFASWTGKAVRRLHPFPYRLDSSNTAQLQPESLVPAWPRLTEYQLTSKMVDFVVCLRFDRDDDLECMRDILLKSNPKSLSINQTLHDPLISAPIALSIFTKHPDQTWDEAQLQISVWVAAQPK